MALDDIREQIKTVLSGVSGIGTVHDYDRFNNDWSKFLTLFKDADGKINGVMFSRSACPKYQATQGEYEKAHIFTLRVFKGLNDADATGIEFDNHLEDIMEAFDPSDMETLNDTCRTINPDWGPMAGAMGMQLDIVDIRMFGNVLSHYAELRLCAVEEVTL
jgi:hypothetical protein